MSYLSEVVLDDSFLWDPIVDRLIDRRRGTGGAVFNIKCPMCLSRNYTPDTTYRCGVWHTPGEIGVNCFNCHFRTRWHAGERLSANMCLFLEHIHVGELEIKRIKHHAKQVVGILDSARREQPEFRIPSFETTTLPPGARAMTAWIEDGCSDPNFHAVVDYLLSRGDVAASRVPFFWSPETEHGLCRKLIIPCFFGETDRLVGWIGRDIDGGKRKYFSQVPKNFLFNSRVLHHPFRKYVLVVEGVFDALSVDGVAALGTSLNRQQIHWLNQCGKEVIVVPDLDHAGQALVDVAVAEGWSVATPNYAARYWWSKDIKDVDEAVRRHGLLYTVQSILATRSSDCTQIHARTKIFNQ